MDTETHPWDPAEHLETAEDRAAYLEAALEDGGPALVATALGDIARAKGMTQTAEIASPLDVEGVNLGFSTEEIVSAVRETRARECS